VSFSCGLLLWRLSQGDIFDSIRSEAWPRGELLVIDGANPSRWGQAECALVEELDKFGLLEEAW
jgi:hypothetical protein